MQVTSPRIEKQSPPTDDLARLIRTHVAQAALDLAHGLKDLAAERGHDDIAELLDEWLELSGSGDVADRHAWFNRLPTNSDGVIEVDDSRLTDEEQRTIDRIVSEMSDNSGHFDLDLLSQEDFSAYRLLMDKAIVKGGAR